MNSFETMIIKSCKLFKIMLLFHIISQLFETSVTQLGLLLSQYISSKKKVQEENNQMCSKCECSTNRCV